MIGALADSWLEIFPAGGIERRLDALPRGACVAVTCSERHGIAAHPEGHPIIGTEELLEQLSAKQRYASYMVTQMCFDPVAIGEWLTDVRARGIHLTARIGLPGVIERKRLVTTALRIGVGQSVGFLKKQQGLAGRLLAAPEYRPDDLLAGLAPLLADPAMGISGLHLYTLNQVGGSESWRTSTLQRLQA